MKLKISQNRTHMLINDPKNFHNLSSHKTEVIILTKIKPHMVKLISTESSIVFLDLKFY